MKICISFRLLTFLAVISTFSSLSRGYKPCKADVKTFSFPNQCSLRCLQKAYKIMIGLLQWGKEKESKK